MIHNLAASLLRRIHKLIESVKMDEEPRLSSSKTTLSSSKSEYPQVDGPIDVAPSDMGGRRKRLAGDVCAVFVHAGAGYHSVQNERVHLAACEE